MDQNISLKLLAIGYDPAIMQVVERLLNSHAGWEGVVALTREEGLAKTSNEKYDAILLCVGVSAADEEAVRQAASHHHPSAKVIRHYGGGSGLLENELRAALDHQ
ncbi:hypothetical protein HF324_17860 [Chitinophaga oryzae]|uniref:Response regulator receiver protein n=1 Tax=Chitinophaga oryzae TaxID=2725414 RepID=A0AAE6ZI97_9BACT|nr:hypothetical protein [Chitinophaga oryzae]QJB33146.1 hypothetical protein HF329_18220 [Chitinophaga oryzae]QJB39622.1 hypothetical protein HF324_17860 [Chitinophaga oryzae]